MAAPATDKTGSSADKTPAAPDSARAGGSGASGKSGAPGAPPPRAAKPRGGFGTFLTKLFLSILALAIVLGIAGYGALRFKDADPRVGVAANYVEQGLAEAQAKLDHAQSAIADLTGAQKPSDARAPTRRAALEKAPLASAERPSELAAPQPPPAPALPAKEPEKPLAQAPAEPPPVAAPEPPQVAPPPEALAPIVTTGPKEKTIVTAPAASLSAAKPPTDADGFSDRDLIAALEGRIDAMSDEIKSLRDKLDAPKNETRAAPETQAPPAREAAAPADNGPAIVVAAFALQRALDAGKPFGDEIAALSRLGAEPAPAAILVEISEKGAPTGAQLRDAFAPIAKRLEARDAGEAGHDAGDLTGHLLQGASKLVKVRPTGQAQAESLEGKIEHLEAALARNDFAGAGSIFDSLPESARTEARAFGESLRQRNEASQAADELLRGAIAALGKK